ncbi:class I SAM-dependent RNA methyltransferase [Alkalibacter rhizosphaerae]|uniref:Class I SAM-dependent RNA methyltransferase n=1 Tax=Alkalibacter rhizosphaerae TaxID=2815577 RepID=A0A975AHH9_9FIRM|nr:class I SAM-dependent RNA methyltransferase [Alkalibacter rhizosphaerae]QSX07510.1 class I SAM-dependent RNA methyltransferase [Alkalibacter rhizosphaerae]
MDRKFQIAAACTFGLEGILKKELFRMGYQDAKADNGKVYFTGTQADVARANVGLRTADRVLLVVGTFEAVTFDELFEKTKALPWEEWIGKKDAFPVAKATSVKSALFSKSDCQRIVKKAVVDRLQSKYRIDWFDETENMVPIHVHILKDQVTLFLDTSGSGLNKRGYRAKGNEAPLKETLAAAMVLLSGWRKDIPLLDPFCGSGTILIEAALLAMEDKPGRHRTFVSETWNESFRSAFQVEKNYTPEQVEGVKITGWDIDEASLAIARENARLAGVDHLIRFEKRDARQLGTLQGKGTIIMNPPYGERLMGKREVEELYRDVGKAYKKLKDHSLHVLTGHLEFERHFGMKAKRNRKLYNGNVLAYFYQYFPRV